MSKKQQRVKPDEWLFRRGYASPEKKYMNPDGTATSRVFKLREKDAGALSVDVKSLTTFAQAIGDVDNFMLFELENRTVLDLGLDTFHDPCSMVTHGYDNPAHAVIIGLELDDDILPGLLAKKSKRVWL